MRARYGYARVLGIVSTRTSARGVRAGRQARLSCWPCWRPVAKGGRSAWASTSPQPKPAAKARSRCLGKRPPPAGPRPSGLGGVATPALVPVPPPGPAALARYRPPPQGWLGLSDTALPPAPAGPTPPRAPFPACSGRCCPPCRRAVGRVVSRARAHAHPLAARRPPPAAIHPAIMIPRRRCCADAVAGRCANQDPCRCHGPAKRQWQPTPPQTRNRPRPRPPPSPAGPPARTTTWIKTVTPPGQLPPPPPLAQWPCPLLSPRLPGK